MALATELKELDYILAGGEVQLEARADINRYIERYNNVSA